MYMVCVYCIYIYIYIYIYSTHTHTLCKQTFLDAIKHLTALSDCNVNIDNSRADTYIKLHKYQSSLHISNNMSYYDDI